MKRWLVFLKERFPPHIYFLIVGGYVASGFAIAVRSVAGGSAMAAGTAAAPAQSALRLILSAVGALLFFLELRIMDDLKDLPKDSTAHQDRPLPRGLIPAAEARRVVLVLGVCMAVFGAALLPLAGVVAGCLYIGVTACLQLMYREFFAGRWLGRRPFLYALAHQPVGFLLALFTVAIFRPDVVLTRAGLGWALLALGAFFAYEICRKLDPAAAPELGYYVQQRGLLVTSFALAACVAAATTGALLARTRWLVLPTEALLAGGYAVYLGRPRMYGIVELLGGLNLVVSLWVPLASWLLLAP